MITMKFSIEDVKSYVGKRLGAYSTMIDSTQDILDFVKTDNEPLAGGIAIDGDYLVVVVDPTNSGQLNFASALSQSLSDARQRREADERLRQASPRKDEKLLLFTTWGDQENCVIGLQWALPTVQFRRERLGPMFMLIATKEEAK